MASSDKLAISVAELLTLLHQLYEEATVLSQEPLVVPTPVDWRIHLYDTVASTNATLGQLLDQGAPEGTVAIAQCQTAGRGQRGRTWQSTAGGIYLSVGLRPEQPAHLAPQLMLCCSWGIAQALHRCHVPVRLKWPNDLTLDGRKLGGILLESRIREQRIGQVVVGVGINGCNATPVHGITLLEWGDRPRSFSMPEDRPSLDIPMTPWIAYVLWGMMGGYRYWQTHGIQSILPNYNALLSHTGQWIPWGDRLVEVMGIVPDGRLWVQTEHGEFHYLSPGDVRLGYVGEDVGETTSQNG